MRKSSVKKEHILSNKLRFNIRRLEKKDYFNGYFELLEQLTTVNKKDIDYNSFCRIFDSMYGPASDVNTHIYVIEDINGKIVALGTILIEQKFIHTMGKVGHIEDIVVDKQYRGQKLGKMIIDYLITVGHKYKCYKIILDCKPKNVKFYEKCGFIKKGVEMAMYIDSKL